MEEVWKEINLASLPENPSRKDPNTINFTGMIFQDFLAPPSSKDPPPPSVYGPPATVLCLGSVSQSHFLGNSDLPLSQTTILQPLPALNVPVDAVTSASGMSARGNRRRLPVTENYSGERRRKRLIKNRESAARSRARKQAYTIELELEVAHWRRENERIRKQLQEFFLAGAQQPKKRTLQRTCTAPF